MRGAAELKAFMAENHIGRDDLLNSQFPEHVQFRASAIKRLRACGLSVSETARVMGCSRSAVRYWSCEEERGLKKRSSRGYYVDLRKYRALSTALEVLYA